VAERPPGVEPVTVFASQVWTDYLSQLFEIGQVKLRRWQIP
jgi:hypothetical protein